MNNQENGGGGYQSQQQRQNQQQATSFFSRMAFLRRAYGEAGSSANISRTPNQHSVSDNSLGDNFYDATERSTGNLHNQYPQSATLQVQHHHNSTIMESGTNNMTQDQQLSMLVKALALMMDTGEQMKMGGSGSSGQKNDHEKMVRSIRTFVEVRIVFLKIGEIDTLKEQYSADAFIQSRWREPLLDGKSTEELKNVDLSALWSPCLYIENALNEQKDSTWQTASVNSRGEAYISERRKLRGVFLENLELENFPLDVQDLSITVVSERIDAEVEIVPDEEEPSTVNVGTFADEQEWKLHQHVEVTTKTVKTEFANQQRSHSAIQVTCRAARRPGYFYYNVFLVMVRFIFLFFLICFILFFFIPVFH